MNNENLKKYYELQKQIETLSQEAETIKQTILNEMNAEGMVSYSDGTYTAKIAKRQTFKYTDENAIIAYLRSHHLAECISTKVNSTTLNKKLKASQALCESLKEYYTENQSQALSVKADKGV